MTLNLSTVRFNAGIKEVPHAMPITPQATSEHPLYEACRITAPSADRSGLVGCPASHKSEHT
jgi:hypothetical protein